MSAAERFTARLKAEMERYLEDYRKEHSDQIAMITEAYCRGFRAASSAFIEGIAIYMSSKESN